MHKTKGSYGRPHKKCRRQSVVNPPPLPSLPIHFSTMPKSKRQKQSDKAALDAANNRADATPVGKRTASATTTGSAATKRKASQSRLKTPTPKKKQNEGAPTSGGHNVSTPSSVASNVNFMTPQKYETLLGVKKQENKLTEVEKLKRQHLLPSRRIQRPPALR